MNSSGSINLSDEHHSHQPSATSPMSLSTSSSKPDVTEVESSGGGGGGLLSRTILRLRGGEGHHAIAECCWYVSLFEVFERCFDPLQALTSGLDLSWFDYIWIVQRFPSYTSVAFAFAVVLRNFVVSRLWMTVLGCVVEEELGITLCDSFLNPLTFDEDEFGSNQVISSSSALGLSWTPFHSMLGSVDVAMKIMILI